MDKHSSMEVLQILYYLHDHLSENMDIQVLSQSGGFRYHLRAGPTL